MKRTAITLLALAVVAGLFTADIAEAGGRDRRKRKLSKIARVYRGSSHYGPSDIGSSERGGKKCYARKAYTITKNQNGQMIWAISQTGRWCVRNRKIVSCSFDKDIAFNDQWWNIWKRRNIRTAADHKTGRYCYHRTVFELEACLRWCFKNWDGYIAQTLRKGGGYDADWGN